jgi:ribose 5-phosphate isomerase B
VAADKPATPEFDDGSLRRIVEQTRAQLARQVAGDGAAGPTPPARPLPAAPAPCAAAKAAPAPAVAPAAGPRLAAGADRRVAIGADHGGFALKKQLLELLAELGWEAWDVGTHCTAAVDYPDYAVKVARAVARGEAWRGIMIDGAGIGSAMAANKVPGVRAATVHNETTAVNSREHNDANVLVLGSGQVNRGLARRIVRIWLETDFAGGRHQQRVDKIVALDREKA